MNSRSLSSTGRRALLVALAALAGPALAQPAATGTEGRPLRIVVGYPAGQTIDIVARQFAVVLQKELGRAVYVDNKAGANGTLGAQDVKGAASDGNMLLVASSGSSRSTRRSTRSCRTTR